MLLVKDKQVINIIVIGTCILIGFLLLIIYVIVGTFIILIHVFYKAIYSFFFVALS